MPTAILYECFFHEPLINGQRRTLVTGQFTFKRADCLYDLTIKARVPEGSDTEQAHRTMRAMAELAALTP